MMKTRESDGISTVLELLEEFPALYKTKKRKNKPDPRVRSGRLQIRQIMEDALLKKIIPTVPSTIPDPLVSKILEIFHEIKSDRLPDIAIKHQRSMGAENVVGALLEDYINSESTKYEWCHCAVDVVNGTDFIMKLDGGWELLQIKNRDNSENSSSKSVRDVVEHNSGVVIKKWFRTFARTGKTNWNKFPDENLKDILNESSFQQHVIKHLKNLKKES